MQTKVILSIIEDYLRRFPTPSSICSYNSVMKLNYSYASPFTDAKINKQLLYPTKEFHEKQFYQPSSALLNFNQKGRIEEGNSFDSILTKQTHQKVIQDDVFGKAQRNKLRNKWIYVAQLKTPPLKSIFNNGKGKLPYDHDFGETYEDVKAVGIFVWNKQDKSIVQVEVQKEYIPACPSFANSQGTSIVFHAYQKQHFGHGLLHCFNRIVKIYQGNLIVKQKKQNQKQNQQQQGQKYVYKTKVLFTDKHKTNMFPAISPCFQYMMYLSGTGKTHSYYLDLVIMKKNEQDKWIEIHRIEQKLVGYYCTLKTYLTYKNEKLKGYVQTIQRGFQVIYEVDIEKKTMQILKSHQGLQQNSYSISQVLSDGTLIGQVSNPNFKSFFYRNSSNENNLLQIIKPLSTQQFTVSQFNDPIPSFYIEDKNTVTKQKPLMILIHGGPHGASDPSLTLMRYTLLKLGYSLLLPNFSGSTGYGVQFVNASLTKIGTQDGQQIIHLLKNILKAHPQITRVHVSGGSYGGYMSALMAARYPQYFKSAIIMNGALSLFASLWFCDIPQWVTVQTLGRERLAGLTAEDYVEIFKQSPISTPAKIPILQFLGAKDRRVPYRQGLFYDAITKESKTPITTYVYQNSAHSLADSVQTSIDVIVKSVLFLQGIKEEDKVISQKKQ